MNIGNIDGADLQEINMLTDRFLFWTEHIQNLLELALRNLVIVESAFLVARELVGAFPKEFGSSCKTCESLG